MDLLKDAPTCCKECGQYLSTRDRIFALLKGSTRPFSASDIADALGRSRASVSTACAVMALQGRIVRRAIGSATWFAHSAWTFNRRDYLLESQRVANKGNTGWATFRLCRSEFGARQEAAYWSRTKRRPVRLVHRGEVLHTWNELEKHKWLHARRTLREVKKLLRSRSRSEASTLAHSSPQ